MALIGSGGYDKRQERARRAELPICLDCPNGQLREALEAGRADSSVVVRDACAVAEQLLRMAGCDSPGEAPEGSAGEFAVQGSQEMICRNANAAAAQTVITHTQLAVSREQP